MRLQHEKRSQTGPDDGSNPETDAAVLTVRNNQNWARPTIGRERRRSDGCASIAVEGRSATPSSMAMKLRTYGRLKLINVRYK